MVREFQMSCLSTTDYIKEYNLVYITAGHRLLVWEYQSLNQWSIYDEIIGNIQKVCFIQSKSPLSFKISPIKRAFYLIFNSSIIICFGKKFPQ